MSLSLYYQANNSKFQLSCIYSLFASLLLCFESQMVPYYLSSLQKNSQRVASPVGYLRLF